MQVFSLHDGPVRDVWRDIGISPNVLESNESMDVAVDWLKYALLVLLASHNIIEHLN